eukprot:gene3809-4762_t
MGMNLTLERRQALNLLPGVYTGENNTRLHFGGIEGMTLPSFLLINSTHGPEQTVVDCEESSDFMSFQGDSGWMATIQIEGFTVKRCVDTIESAVGALALTNNKGVFTLKNLVIKDCLGILGVVFIYENFEVRIVDSLFLRNTHLYDPNIGQDNTAMARSGVGGAIMVMYSTIEIYRSQFQDNRASLAGGAIAAVGSAQHTVYMIMEDCRVDGNTAGRMGGMDDQWWPVFTEAPRRVCLLTLSGGEVVMRAEMWQGIYIYRSLTQISQSSILNNRVCRNDDLITPADGSGGGIKAVSAELSISNAFLSGNLAYGSGGGASLDAEVTLMVKGLVVANNTCQGGGGGLSMTYVQGDFDDLLLEGNRASAAGGAVECIKSMMLSGSTVVRANAANEGGGLYLHTCRLEGQAMVAEGNLAKERGGALMMTSTTFIKLEQGSAFTSNAVDGEGGAVYLNTGTELSLSASNLSSNTALDRGGAMHSLGILRIGNSSIAYNSLFIPSSSNLPFVYDHPGAYNSVSTFDNISFEGNCAEQGGAAVYLSVAPGAPSTLLPSLRGIAYRGNRVLGGGYALFWDPVDGAAAATSPPACSSCLLGEGNHAGYSNLEGYASPFYALRTPSSHPVPETSGYVLRQPLSVDLVDMYNLTVVVDSSTTVIVEIAQGFEECILSGTVRVPALYGVARFPNLLLLATPGTTCTLRLEAQGSHGAVISTTTRVHLRTCVTGEWLNGVMCIRCPTGTLSFSNTSACEECPEGAADRSEGASVWCPGGSTWEIPEGAWLAPGAAECDSARCLLDRVARCSFPDACKKEGGRRRGASASDAALLELCDTQRYAGGVLCAGSVNAGCSIDHANVLHSCAPCPSAEAAMVRTLVGAVFGLALLMFVFRVLVRLASPENLIDDAVDGVASHGPLIARATGAMGLLIGYWQVVSQVPHIYGNDLPTFFDEYADFFYVFSIDCEKWLRLKCFLHAFAPEVLGNDIAALYWANFYQTMALPAVSLIVFGIRIVWQWPRKTEMVRVRYVVSTVFTGVCAVLQSWYYENDETQLWLQEDMSVECKSLGWRVGATVAGIVITLFVFGFPATVLVMMYQSRRYRMVRMAFADATQHLEKLRTREWITLDSFWVNAHEAHQRRKSIVRSPGITPEVAESKDDTALGTVVLFVHESSYTVREDGHGEDRRFTSTINNPLADVPEHEFKEDGWGITDMGIFNLQVLHRVEESPSVTLGCSAEGAEQAPFHPRCATPANPSELHEDPVLLTLDKEYPEEVEMLVNGVHPVRVALLNKEAWTNGERLLVPLTLMDYPPVKNTLTQFIQPFEDKVYFWHCWEMLRRVLLTGGVILVDLYTESMAVASIYALNISVLSLVLQAHFNPFVLVAMNRLFILQMGIVLSYQTSRNKQEEESLVGIGLVVTQIVLVAYGMTLIIPAYRPLLTVIFKRTKGIRRTVAAEVRNKSRRLTSLIN